MSEERILMPHRYRNRDADESTLRGIVLQKYPKWALNGIVGILLLSLIYLSYAFYANQTEAGSAFTPSGKPIQIDVLNGCGVSGAASKVAAYLRKQGFDVVEVRNYRSFDIRETMVIDRIGNLKQAHEVAKALGVNHDNVVQEINTDYYVELSVVVGRNFTELQRLQSSP